MAINFIIINAYKSYSIVVNNLVSIYDNINRSLYKPNLITHYYKALIIYNIINVML